jgi:hypothetical protein
MKILIATILFAGLLNAALGQTLSLGDSLSIIFSPMDKSISDSSRLYCSVVYENKTNRPIPVYKKLSPGYFNDKFCNVIVTVEKESAGKYLEEVRTYYDRNSNIVYSDSLRHYDLPKSALAPFSNDTLYFNLYHSGVFEKGNYRIKITLRVNTILNTTEHRPDPTGATVPPEDEIQYISSDWIYFEVMEIK